MVWGCRRLAEAQGIATMPHSLLKSDSNALEFISGSHFFGVVTVVESPLSQAMLVDVLEKLH